MYHFISHRGKVTKFSEGKQLEVKIEITNEFLLTVSL